LEKIETDVVIIGRQQESAHDYNGDRSGKLNKNSSARHL
jgi:hypothetical protein